MFYKVSCFQPVGNFYVPGDDLGCHFGCPVGALGGILLIWEAPKNKPEFDRILGHPPGEPKSRDHGQGVVKKQIPGGSRYRLQPSGYQSSNSLISI